MNRSISPGILPPPPGLEKEEPDLWEEDDIPRDDRGSAEEGESVRPAREPRGK